MYELENKNQNQKILQYHSIFNLFNNNTSVENILSELKEKKVYLETYLIEKGEDVPSKKLLHLINTIEQNRDEKFVEHLLKGYHTTIREYLVEN